MSLAPNHSCQGFLLLPLALDRLSHIKGMSPGESVPRMLHYGSALFTFQGGSR